MATNLNKNVVRLSKNDVVNLTKKDPGMKKIIVGLGWDEVKATNKGGLFGGLFGGTISGGDDIDCDAFAVLLENGHLNDVSHDTVYFGNLKHRSGAVVHTGDNLTGEGEGDDEQLIIDTSLVPKNIDSIMIAVNIYRGKERGQHFGKVENAFIRLVNMETNNEVCRYDLSNGGYSGYVTVTFGELHRETDGSWQFRAVGEGDTANSIGDYTHKFH